MLRNNALFLEELQKNAVLVSTILWDSSTHITVN